MSNHNQAPGVYFEQDSGELALNDIGQIQQLKAALLTEGLLANGYELVGVRTRRDIFVELLNSPEFSPGNRPTLEKYNNDKLGPENWACVPVDTLTTLRNASGNGTPDIAVWQNALLRIYERPPERVAEHLQSASDIIRDLEEQFPDVTPAQS